MRFAFGGGGCVFVLPFTDVQFIDTFKGIDGVAGVDQFNDRVNAGCVDRLRDNGACHIRLAQAFATAPFADFLCELDCFPACNKVHFNEFAGATACG